MNFKWIGILLLCFFISCAPVSYETEVGVAEYEESVEMVDQPLAEGSVSYEEIDGEEYEVTTYSMTVSASYWNQNCSPMRGVGSFQAALSHMTWTGYAWHQTLYLFGQSLDKNDKPASTYITNLRVIVSDGWNKEIVYSENYTLIEYGGKPEAVAELYAFISNPIYQITWSEAKPL